jgi:hypothetical protein
MKKYKPIDWSGTNYSFHIEGGLKKSPELTTERLRETLKRLGWMKEDKEDNNVKG